MGIINPDEHDVLLRNYGLARVQAVRTVGDSGDIYKEVELFITGHRHYLKAQEARDIGKLLLAEAAKVGLGE